MWWWAGIQLTNCLVLPEHMRQRALFPSLPRIKALETLLLPQARAAHSTWRRFVPSLSLAGIKCGERAPNFAGVSLCCRLPASSSSSSFPHSYSPYAPLSGELPLAWVCLETPRASSQARPIAKNYFRFLTETIQLDNEGTCALLLLMFCLKKVRPSLATGEFDRRWGGGIFPLLEFFEEDDRNIFFLPPRSRNHCRSCY